MFAHQGWLILLVLIPAIIAGGIGTHRRSATRLALANISVAPVRGRRLRLGLWAAAAAPCGVAG